ncbi:hypothetical protein GCM10010359_22170 [Streptomyces morookaense]|nr:hypothetical protein GCM10010359_22170 [Streptomyces morookaense]
MLAGSADFRRLWTAQFPFDAAREPSRPACPELGTTLRLSWEAFEPADAGDAWMVVCTAAEGSPSADALRTPANRPAVPAG